MFNLDKTNWIDIDTTKTILNDSDGILFQLSETVFHWSILYLVVELHIMVFYYLYNLKIKIFNYFNKASTRMRF